jgi:hypothetical protein
MTDYPNPPQLTGLGPDAIDVDGAAVESGPERGAHDVDPTADYVNPRVDTDGTPVGLADVGADAAPNQA